MGLNLYETIREIHMMGMLTTDVGMSGVVKDYIGFNCARLLFDTV